MALHPNSCFCDSCCESQRPEFCDPNGEPYTDLPPLSTGSVASEATGTYTSGVDPTAFGHDNGQSWASMAKLGRYNSPSMARADYATMARRNWLGTLRGVVYQSITQFPSPDDCAYLNPPPSQMATSCQIACLQAATTLPESVEAGGVETSSDGVQSIATATVAPCVSAIACNAAASQASAPKTAQSAALTSSAAANTCAQAIVDQLSQAATSPSGIAPTVSANAVSMPLPPPPNPLITWGILGALAYYILRK